MARPFERPATIALPDSVGEGLALDGLYVPVEGATTSAVMAAPHPLMGGSMESPVVTEVAWACERSGRASLRFNWRGIGASGGTPSGEAGDADVDYAAAVAFMTETVPGRHLAAGYSFGAVAAVRSIARDPVPERLLLVAPPTSMLDLDALARFAGPVLVVAGQDDEWVDARALAERAVLLEDVRVEVIPRCDHFFMSGLGELSKFVADWLGAAD